MSPRTLTCLLALLPLAVLAAASAPHPIPSREALDAEVAHVMQATQAQGLAIAVIDDGRVLHVAAYGKRNAAGDRLQTDTVMYGASLTKAVVAYTAMQLVEEGVLVPGEGVVSMEYKGQQTVAGLAEDGRIHWRGESDESEMRVRVMRAMRVMRVRDESER